MGEVHGLDVVPPAVATDRAQLDGKGGPCRCTRRVQPGGGARQDERPSIHMPSPFTAGRAIASGGCGPPPQDTALRVLVTCPPSATQRAKDPSQAVARTRQPDEPVTAPRRKPRQPQPEAQ